MKKPLVWLVSEEREKGFVFTREGLVFTREQ